MTAAVSAALTAEQRAIVDLGLDGQTFVVAGPGTGKTHTLIHRAAALLRDDVAASEILVLSFTNAVVGELRRRLAQLADSDAVGSGADAAYVRPTTIDSLAGRIASRGGEDPIGFEATVRAATAAIGRDPEDAEVTRYRHIVIDEAQDLVGVRLAFIEALLGAGDTGFTVLGDPAQGIYGFSDRGAANHATGIDVLRLAFPAAGLARLTEDHRSRRTGASPGRELRDLVLETSGADVVHRRVLGRLRDCERLSASQLSTVLRRADENTGVLCRTNGEVLHLSSLLSEDGVAHQVRRAASARTAPAWVATMLGDVDASELSRKQFHRLAADESDGWRDASWKALRRLAGSRSGAVDMQRLRENLHRLNPEEAPDVAKGVPVLSTVHRSKGLEYETTVVLEPYGLDEGQASDQEIRILFVAMTRARTRTLTLARPKLPGRLQKARTGRWTMVPWRGRGLLRVELGVGDTESGLGEIDSELIKVAQGYLATQVAPGDPVELHLISDTGNYAVEHRQTRIGVTGAAFRPFATSRPRRISDVRIDCLRSAAGDPTRTQNLGIGTGGLWLVPEMVGLGRLHWKEPVNEQVR